MLQRMVWSFWLRAWSLELLTCGDTPSAVLRGAADFVDAGLPAIAPLHDGHRFETIRDRVLRRPITLPANMEM